MSIALQGLAFAFMAGIFSIFSPCGFALLPGYVFYYMGSSFTIGKALMGGISCTLGLITVFTLLGGLASGLGEITSSMIPVFDLIAASVLILLGAIMMTGNSFPYLSMPVKPVKRRGSLGFYLFGLIYGLAGIGCSAPIFISVLLYAMSKGLVNGMFTFVAYAFGMAVPIILTSILLAEAKEYVIKKFMKNTPLIQRVSGVFLIIIGLYLVYFYFATYY
jgi:cytochrome c-type biogenesis protein